MARGHNGSGSNGSGSGLEKSLFNIMARGQVLKNHFLRLLRTLCRLLYNVYPVGQLSLSMYDHTATPMATFPC